MASPSQQRARAVQLLKGRGMLRLKQLVEAGIASETVARMVRDGELVRPARGLYRLPDMPLDAAHTLAEAAILVPGSIVCLTSALQFHHLTLQMPSAVWMAIPRGAWRPRIERPSIRFVRFSGPALTEGIGRHRIEGVDVAITTPARSIVDSFRYRSKIGIDTAIEALREGLDRRLCTPDELWSLARQMRAWTVMRPYVETVAAHGG